MAQNPYVNKVEFGGDTLIDLTEDSVTANTLLEGETAHNAAGASITGTAKQGHTIKNASGTALTQRSDLQFSGYLKATDDTTDQNNSKTVVSDAPEEVEYSVWKNMTDQQKTGKKWIIKNVPKTGGTPTNNSVSVTADGVKTASALFSELYALIDFTKITRNSVVSIYDISANATYNLRLSRKDPNDKLLFHGIINADATNAYDLILTLDSSNVVYEYYALSSSSPNVSFASFTNFVYPSGATFTLYYNLIASAGVGDIDAGDVSYGSGTVEDALDDVNDQLESAIVATNGENVSGTFYYTKVGRMVMGCGHMTVTQAISAYGVLVSNLPTPFGKMPWNGAAVLDDNKYNRYYVDYVSTSGGMGVVKSRDALTSGQTIRLSVCYMANDL